MHMNKNGIKIGNELGMKMKARPCACVCACVMDREEEMVRCAVSE